VAAQTVMRAYLFDLRIYVHTYVGVIQLAVLDANPHTRFGLIFDCVRGPPRKLGVQLKRYRIEQGRGRAVAGDGGRPPLLLTHVNPSPPA
jgi:hypothetical protein